MRSDAIPAENQRPLWRRLTIYQSERFPFVQNAPLLAIFAFASVSFSRSLRQAPGFIPLGSFAVGVVTVVTFFLLLRIADEFKDAEDDARYRPYRAVPRGLVTLKELGWIAAILVLVILALNAFLLPRLLPALGAALVYFALMSKEFFVRAWLRRHPIAYMLSHMMIMPVADLYTTGLDWLNERASASHGLLIFLAVSYLNGMVLEIGRKTRSPQTEEEGVETYSALWGSRRATITWLILMMGSYVLAVLAASAIGFPWEAFALLAIPFGLALIRGITFTRTLEPKIAQRFESLSGVWIFSTYAVLGLLPYALRFFRVL